MATGAINIDDMFVGYTKESLKVVQNFRNHQRYERSRESEAITEAKFQLVSLLGGFRFNVSLPIVDCAMAPSHYINSSQN